MSVYPTDNIKLIYTTFENKIDTGLKNINNKLQNNLAKIQSDMKKVPSTYNNLKNQLSVANEQTKKRTEEQIANTGSHTASGFAMSKRLNNSNAYLKELNNLNISQKNEMEALEGEMRKAQSDAEAEKNKLVSDSIDNMMKYHLEEIGRMDELYEKNRVNTASIEKMKHETELKEAENTREQQVHDIDLETLPEKNRSEIDKVKAETDNISADTEKTKTDTEISRNQEKRDEEMHSIEKTQKEDMFRFEVDKMMSEIYKNNSTTEKNKVTTQIAQNKDKREEEVHDVEMKYLDDTLSQKYENTVLEGERIRAQTSTEEAKKEKVESDIAKAQSSSGSSSGSSKSGSSKSNSNEVKSKMTPAQLADNITKQTGTAKYDGSGKLYYEKDDFKAYVLLMEWKKKFDLSDQVVNDTAIYLGIQSYL